MAQLAAELEDFLQSRHPCRAQAVQVSTHAQPQGIIAAFMVNVILICLSWQTGFQSVLLSGGVSAVVAAFLGEKEMLHIQFFGNLYD